MLNKVHNSPPFGQISSNANNRWYVEFRNGQDTNLTPAVSIQFRVCETVSVAVYY
jgi:hypothetical protein